MRTLDIATRACFGLSIIACAETPTDRADTHHSRYPFASESSSYLRYRVRDEPQASRCTRRANDIANALSALGQRVTGSDLSLGALDMNVMSSTIGSERFLCFTPSGRVEFFNMERMNVESLQQSPSREAFIHSAESVVVELARFDLVDLDEVDFSAIKYGSVEAGIDNGDDPGLSKSATVGARISFHRRLGELPVFRNFITIRLNQALQVVSVKLAWIDVENEGLEVPTQVTPAEALDTFVAKWPMAKGPTVHTGFLAGDLLETQTYLEPWHVFSTEVQGRPVDAIPAVAALVSLKGFGEVDMNAYGSR